MIKSMVILGKFMYYYHIKSIVLLNFAIVRAVEISNEFLDHFVPR